MKQLRSKGSPWFWQNKTLFQGLKVRGGLLWADMTSAEVERNHYAKPVGLDTYAILLGSLIIFISQRLYGSESILVST